MGVVHAAGVWTKVSETGCETWKEEVSCRDAAVFKKRGF